MCIHLFACLVIFLCLSIFVRLSLIVSLGCAIWVYTVWCMRPVVTRCIINDLLPPSAVAAAAASARAGKTNQGVFSWLGGQSLGLSIGALCLSVTVSLVVCISLCAYRWDWLCSYVSDFCLYRNPISVFLSLPLPSAACLSVCLCSRASVYDCLALPL